MSLNPLLENRDLKYGKNVLVAPLGPSKFKLLLGHCSHKTMQNHSSH